MHDARLVTNPSVVFVALVRRQTREYHEASLARGGNAVLLTTCYFSYVKKNTEFHTSFCLRVYVKAKLPGKRSNNNKSEDDINGRITVVIIIMMIIR